MDSSYAGGREIPGTKSLLEKIEKMEETIIVDFFDEKNALVESFRKFVEKEASFDESTFRAFDSFVTSFDKIERCKMCKNLFTVNRSYGKHDCYCHYGYRDYSKPGRPTWSCCGKNLDEMGCLECDHLGSSVVEKYSNAFPKMELSLGPCLYGAILPKWVSFFMKNYLADEKMAALVRKNENYVQAKLSFVSEDLYRSLIKSVGSASLRSRYFRCSVTKKGIDGIKKKSNVYVNIRKSKLILPLSRTIGEKRIRYVQ